MKSTESTFEFGDLFGWELEAPEKRLLRMKTKLAVVLNKNPHKRTELKEWLAGINGCPFVRLDSDNTILLQVMKIIGESGSTKFSTPAKAASGIIVLFIEAAIIESEKEACE